MNRLLWASALLGVMGCSMESPGELVVEVTPSQLVGNAKASVRVAATTGTGNVGTGSVSLTASAGTLADATVTLDAYGTAKTTYTCDVAIDAHCIGRAIITAKWTTRGAMVEAEDSVQLGAGSGGGSGVTGGGSGVSGGGSGATGGGTAAGGGGGATGGVRRVTVPCSLMDPRPGAQVSCCRASDGTGFGPRCPAVVVEPGATVEIPFRLDGGGEMRLPITYESRQPYESEAACRADEPRITSDGGYNILTSCDQYGVQSTGQWDLVSFGGCQTAASLLSSACDLPFAPGNTATAHTMAGAFFFLGGEYLKQSNDDTYVFVFRRQ